MTLSSLQGLNSVKGLGSLSLIGAEGDNNKETWWGRVWVSSDKIEVFHKREEETKKIGELVTETEHTIDFWKYSLCLIPTFVFNDFDFAFLFILFCFALNSSFSLILFLPWFHPFGSLPLACMVLFIFFLHKNQAKPTLKSMVWLFTPNLIVQFLSHINRCLFDSFFYLKIDWIDLIYNPIFYHITCRRNEVTLYKWGKVLPFKLVFGERRYKITHQWSPKFYYYYFLFLVSFPKLLNPRESPN